MSDEITKEITARVTSSLGRAFLEQNNLPFTNTVLNTIVPSISSGVAKETTSIVNKEANFQLNEIPKNLIGPYNPVDLVSTNLSVNSLTDTLRNNLGSQVQSQVSDSIVKKIDDVLRLNLPGGTNNPALITLKTNILNSVQNDVGKIVNIALSSFSNGVFNTGTIVPPIISQIESLFSSGSSSIGLQKYNEQYNSSIVSKSLAESSRFKPLDNDNLSKLQVTKTGFIDPTASYPTEEYKNRPDTNKLATGDLNGTVVQKKNNDRMIGAKLPGNSSWSQPESPYKGEYPYNKVTQTEQGHIIEIDDTPGAERLHIYHKSGTFVEIDSNGSLVKRTKGSDYEIIDRNGYISIAGKADISINGACNIYVGNDANIEVDGDTNLTCHNDITAQAGGAFRLSAVESFSIRSANVFIEADDELNFLSANVTKLSSKIIHSNASTNMYVTAKDYYGKSENNYYIEVVNDSHFKISGDQYITSDNFYGSYNNQYIEVDNDSHFKISGDQYITSDNFYGSYNDQYIDVVNDSHLNVFGDQYISSDNLYTYQDSSFYADSGSDINILASGDVNLDGGGSVNVQDGLAQPSLNASNSNSADGSNSADSSKKATKALNSYAGLLSGRKNINYIDLADPLFLTIADKYVLSAEEQGVSDTEINDTKNKAIRDGIVLKENFLENPVPLESDNPKSNNSLYINPGNELKNISEAPENFKLSPNFTLGMLSNKAAITKSKLVAQAGKTYGELLFNLSAVALNICEPILKLYPNMFVTSAFRLKTESSSSSQHPLGQAVDIQFKGISKKDYYDIAKVLATKLNYDQLLLEYSSSTNNPWIHISIDPEKRNRTQVATFNNHQLFSGGLSQLA